MMKLNLDNAFSVQIMTTYDEIGRVDVLRDAGVVPMLEVKLFSSIPDQDKAMVDSIFQPLDKDN